MRRLRIFTWHVHGTYLYSLCQLPHDLVIPARSSNPRDGYAGITTSYPWPANLQEIPVDQVCREQFDCILFQSAAHYLKDQHEILSPEQRKLPRIFLEHDPPREHPTDTRHVVDDPSMLLVHVTAFNQLMWDNNRTPSTSIDHGMLDPGYRYTGELERGIVVVNHIAKRGRRLGADLYYDFRQKVPLDLVGMGWEEAGGIGEIAFAQLPDFEARYRFFFHPVRYTSLGMALCEAMLAGLPVVGLATTELVSVIQNGHSGIISTDPQPLLAGMRELLKSPALAKRLGQSARRVALERFAIARFIDDWNRALSLVTGTPVAKPMAFKEGASEAHRLHPKEAIHE